MGIWSLARELAAQTPADRNRYVDFLRAASILVVIIGHWLISAVHFVDGDLAFEHLFEIQPWTQWLTWLFQVMPIFFIVGGYANAVSLESAKRKQIGYAGWLAARLNRLVTPVLLEAFPWRILNIHPALLPAFPGLRAQGQALDYGVRITGATVHFVDEGTDSGPIVAQGAVPVLAGDDHETLRGRILRMEHRLYPMVLRWAVEDRLAVSGRRVTVTGDPPTFLWSDSP